jgi:enoyl-[acyl-carrier protein] reductase I
MGLLTGKNALIFGVANKNSIAWGITEAFHREGANIGLSYAGEMLTKRIMPLAESIGCDFVEQADVRNDEQLDGLFSKVKDRFGKIDILIHAVAFANQDDLRDKFMAVSRENFALAMDISVFSLVALTQRVVNMGLMTAGGNVLTLSYYGAEKVVPHYNIMGVAKSALESSVRYLAYDLGREGIRVNGISAGPIKTLAAAGIPGFRDMLRFSEMASPLGKLVTPEHVGQTALWLCSDMASMVTGEIVHVDAGYNIMGIPLGAREDQKEGQ